MSCVCRCCGTPFARQPATAEFLHEIVGQEHAKRATEIAWAGGHPIAFIGGAPAEEFASCINGRLAYARAIQPCPCGNLGNPKLECTCFPDEVRRFRGTKEWNAVRVAGGLMVEVPEAPFRAIQRGTEGNEPETAIGERVARANGVQRDRQAKLNHELTARDVRQWCAPDSEGERLLELAVQGIALTARDIMAVLRIARTIADLDVYSSCPRKSLSELQARHIAEAVAYRSVRP